jgi:hypothetical protein
MVLPPATKLPEQMMGNFVANPRNLEQLQFQQQSAAALGKSMNLAIQGAQPISSMQRAIVTDSEYVIPVQEQIKYTGVRGIAPTSQTPQQTKQKTVQTVQKKRPYKDWEF